MSTPLFDLNSGTPIPPPPRVVCMLFPDRLEPELHTRLAEACLRFTPQVAIRTGGEAIFLEISRCRSLFSEDTLIARLQRLLRQFIPHKDAQTRICIARSPGLALAFARFGGRAPERFPLESFDAFVSPFAEDATLQKKLHTLLPPLRGLGITTLGEFLKLPAASLTRRFQRIGAEIHAAVHAAFSDRGHGAWPAFRSPESIIESIDLFEVDTLAACENQEFLLFALKPVIERLCSRLYARSVRATALELQINPDSKNEKKILLRFPLPQAGAQGIFRLTREHLQQELSRRPLEGPVHRMGLEVTELAPGCGAQRDFFSKKQEEGEDFASLLARLTLKLGPRKAFHAEAVDRHLPEATWRRTLKPWKEKPMPPQGLTLNRNWLRSIARERPSRLLKQPLRLDVIGEWLITQDPRRNAVQRWQSFEWTGPERIVGEWWENDELAPVRRDYYQVASTNGERLWIYQTPDDEFYLHGYFD